VNCTHRRPNGTVLPNLLFSCAALLLLSRPQSAVGQVPKDKATDYAVEAYVYEPRQLKPTEENVKRLKLPDGFKLSKFAEELSNTRMLAIGDDAGRRLYVTRREQGDCLLLRDENGDGQADDKGATMATGAKMHGIALHENKAYLATVREVLVADIKPDGAFGEAKPIIKDLPDGGQHPNRTLAVGPKDGKLYITVGSTCNACEETNKEAATIVRAETDGTTRSIFATGLRNTIGFGWHPQTGQMWGMDHGIDWLGNDKQKEELNLLVEGKFYGWPYILGEKIRNPQDDPPEGTTFEDLEASTTLPTLSYTAHSAPLQMAFCPPGAFPKEYHGDAFVAMRGSWNRKPPSGYEVVRIDYDDSGKPQSIEPFLTGFLVEQGEGDWGQFARLAGLTFAPDGSAMFLSDDKNGVIYRITYDGGRP